MPEAGIGLASPAEVRAACREGRLVSTTSGLAAGFAQANFVAVPRAVASDFASFCRRNPRPCPLLWPRGDGDLQAEPILPPGSAAPGADLRRDLPRYRVYRDGGLVEETTDVGAAWRDDLTPFLLGCSFGFESALVAAGIRLRHQEEGRVVPMYLTDVECASAGPFRGRMVVSMRPISVRRTRAAAEISGAFPEAHGAPVHVGDPGRIGIADLDEPDFGQAGAVLPDETPMFWACGVTAEVAARNARLPLVITHAPGHMLATDLPITPIPPLAPVAA